MGDTVLAVVEAVRAALAAAPTRVLYAETSANPTTFLAGCAVAGMATAIAPAAAGSPSGARRSPSFTAIS